LRRKQRERGNSGRDGCGKFISIIKYFPGRL
jgi:hypothetical protein